ncbi:MAG: hypothetical protein KAH44_25870, partial [Oricola sp.]|nr:hypothetical protein [Oricola sp.]
MKNESTMGGGETSAELFQRYHAALRTRVGDAKYTSWFKDLGLEEYSEECVTLSTGSEAKRDMLDCRFFPVLRETWLKEVGPFQKMRLTVLKNRLSEHAARVDAKEEKRAAAAEAVAEAGQPAAATRGPKEAKDGAFEALATALDPRRTFSSFAVDASNRIAWAAAHEALSEGRARELIYVYGPSGVGKTHLLQAIAHAWLEDASRGAAGY